MQILNIVYKDEEPLTTRSENLRADPKIMETLKNISHELSKLESRMVQADSRRRQISERIKVVDFTFFFLKFCEG